MNKNGENNMEEAKPIDIDVLYRDREDFCVVALTGYSGSGCSTLAGYMADKKFYEGAMVRNAAQINIKCPASKQNSDIYFDNLGQEVNKKIALLNFKQKYAICQNFIKENYKSYTVIRYSWVLLFMALEEVVRETKSLDEFKATVKELIADKFRLSVDEKREKDYKEILKKMGIGINLPEDKDMDFFTATEWENLYKELQELMNQTGNTYNIALARIMGVTAGNSQSSSFLEFQKKLTDWMFKTDYYRGCFFYHRLGYQLRKSGRAIPGYDNCYHLADDFSKIYCVVKKINCIIKGIRHQNETVDGSEQNKGKSECRVVIDSIRNSLEARYLKERYSAFYLIAVHEEAKNRKENLRKKIEDFLEWDEKKAESQQEFLTRMIEKVWELGTIEQENKDFEEGKFAAHNVERCVADAEIHLVNTQVTPDSETPYFHSMAEQWMKYAALILHPGLITPSAEERCMVVAYTAKFNSGCLSRQVGAVITNYAHAIRSIGWNDVPYGQTPCALRSVLDFTSLRYDGEVKEGKDQEYLYSKFERGEYIPNSYKNESFTKRLRSHYKLSEPHAIKEKLKGLPYSYCFKSLHNKFEGEKNQVHTRALHAEENAILQMARFGGMGLENGIIYVTASPCELCCKKLYQIGVRKIVFIDEYPGISRENIISIGFKRPDLKQFQGAFGATYFKLYQPIMPYKEELGLRLNPPTSDKNKKAIEEVNAALEELKDKIKEASALSPEIINEMKKLLEDSEKKMESTTDSKQETDEEKMASTKVGQQLSEQEEL